MWNGFKKSIGSFEFVKSLIAKFLTVFGALTVVIKPLSSIYYQNAWGFKEYLLQGILALVLAAIWAFPKLKFSTKLSSPNVRVTIKVGDLFDEEDAHLVIGATDVFDTELGEIIAAHSIQGQMLTKKFHGNKNLLDQEIKNALAEKKLRPKKDNRKTRGKNERYPIGTTIAIGTTSQRFFLTAYSFMTNRLMSKSTPNGIWKALGNLWHEVRVKGQGKKVAMGILGSDLARTSTTREMLINMIILSFVLASKERFITRELVILIHPKDMEHVNLVELQNYVKKLCY
ncbi:MAG: macro domain-containing protein [Tumebacillaceae bacterium]